MGFTLKRRTLLRGATAFGTAALALPVLDAMLDNHGVALANGDPLPKRLGVFYWGNGRSGIGWAPTSDGLGGWLPSPNLQPLVDRGVAADVSVVSGLNAGSATGCHVPARAFILGGSLNANDPAAADLNPGVSLSNLPSFDQVAADAIGTGTLFPSIEVGISRRGFNGVEDMFSCAWRDGSVLPAELDPAALFDRIFAGFEPDDSVRQARLSVLDAVLADADALGAKLGSADRIRLESHLDALRDLEIRIATEPPVCSVPNPPAAAGTEGPEPLRDRTEVMADLIAMALACDLTRVFTFRFTQALGDTVFDEIGMAEGLHNISHLSEQQHSDCVTYTIDRYADLITRLSETMEGETRLLDQCAVMAMSELTLGQIHDVSDTPLLVAGGCGGALKPGTFVQAPAGTVASALPFTLLKALDLPISSFGEGEALVSTPLTDMMV